MIGRNVNLASRIQGYTKGGQLLVTTETLSEAGEQVHENSRTRVRALLFLIGLRKYGRV